MTLYTSAPDPARTYHLKATGNYIIVTAFCILFGAVYEHFSFGVFSFYMIYAFAIPFALGLIPSFLAAVSKEEVAVNRLSERLRHTAVAILTTGSVFKGIIEIYGTGSRFAPVYLIVGCAFLAASVITAMIQSGSKAGERNTL